MGSLAKNRPQCNPETKSSIWKVNTVAWFEAESSDVQGSCVDQDDDYKAWA